MQTSDFEVMITLPATGKCAGIRVMSAKETIYPAAVCAEMKRRSLFITSQNYVMLRGDVQKNCQYQKCKQITGAFDGLFLTLDEALQKLP